MKAIYRANFRNIFTALFTMIFVNTSGASSSGETAFDEPQKVQAILLNFPCSAALFTHNAVRSHELAGSYVAGVTTLEDEESGLVQIELKFRDRNNRIKSQAFTCDPKTNRVELNLPGNRQ